MFVLVIAGASAALIASSSVAWRDTQAAPDQRGDASEVYVAQLDAAWDVTREIRVPCSMQDGCSVELAGKTGAPSVHVRFQPLRAGTVAVATAVEDASGLVALQPTVTLDLDRSGFAATHLTPGLTGSAAVADAPGAGTAGQSVLLMAVQVPGWAAPVGFSHGAGGDRT